MGLNIAVCVKQVPVSNNVKIDPKTNNLARLDEVGVMNPFDQNAIEAALRLKTSYGGKVTIISMGPPNFELTLRQGLAMGADEAVLLSSRAFAGADTLATGYVLSQAIKQINNFDLIFFGRQSIDADTGQVGPIVAEFLDWPQVTYISEIKALSTKKIRATRLMENMEQTIEVQLPAVLTVRGELNQPRYPSPRNIMQSYQKDITILDEKSLKVDMDRVGVKGSRTIVRKVWSPEKSSKAAISLGDSPKDAATNLLKVLHSRDIL